MEREDIIAATEEHLRQYNLGELAHYKDSTQEQFIMIEKYFLAAESRIKRAIEEMKSINFNMRGICNEINISKSTVYNNPNTLRLYIENRIADIEKQDMLLKNKNDKARERISELESFLSKTIIDQIEFNNLKVYNEHLLTEVNRLIEKNEVLGLERAEFVKKFNAMELELRRFRNLKGNLASLKQEKS
jgi:hypothetical protein